MKILLSTKHQAPSTSSGFTIIELTVVLAVIAALMGGMIALATSSLENKSYRITAAKLKMLQQALADYRIAYNKLPCPASSATAANSANFGLSAANTNSHCGGGSPAADVSNSTAAAAVGMVPVRTLGLSDEMAVDGWGRRIRYAVATAFVADDAFDGVAPTAATAYITVNNNDNGLAMTDKAIYALISAGADGHGAYSGALGGTSAPSALNAGMTNANTLINCQCTSAAAYNSTYDSATPLAFVQGEVKPNYANALDNFDDLVAFATRLDLRNPSKE